MINLLSILGYWVTVATIDRLGRIPIQYIGFGAMAVLLVIVSIAFTELETQVWAFVVLYSFTFFFANWGPNATTFVLPVEIFPTQFRSTCHGISAASGKLGAIIGVYGIGTMNYNLGTQKTLGILSIFMFLGMICTIFIPETKNKSLEDLSVTPNPIYNWFRKRHESNFSANEKTEVVYASW